MVGLVNACERFDPNAEGGFVPFAVSTIVGELKRHFRDRTWSVRVPRSLKENALRVRAAIEALEQQGVSLTVDHLASETGLTGDDVLDAMEGYQARRAASLDAPAPSWCDDPLIDAIAIPDKRLDTTIDLAALAPAIAELSERDRRLIELRFIHEMSQSEIGREIGVSQMQVSRLLRSICEHLHRTVVP
jgi:RNA polymerase sigma-B factor